MSPTESHTARAGPVRAEIDWEDYARADYLSGAHDAPDNEAR
jgi:hypothetical protein